MNHPTPTPTTAPWESTRPTSPGRRLRRFVPWLMLVGLLAAVAWGLKPKPVLIETGVVARQPLTVKVSEEGKTRIRNRYVVSCPLHGRMSRVSLRPGDPVEAGKTEITRMDASPVPLLDARSRAQAEAALAAAEATRRQAEEILAAREAARQFAAAELSRVQSVTAQGTLSASDRDRARIEDALRAADFRAASFALQVAGHEVTRARAMLERPDAAPAQHQVPVLSPVTGVVLRVMQESEAELPAGTAILEIGDPADLEIEAEILSRDAVAVHPGDPVDIEQWGGEIPLQARVRRVEPAAFTKISALGVEEQRVIVLCDLPDPPAEAKRLGDRFRVEVRIAIWHQDQTLSVPSGALFREGNVWKTYVLQDGMAKLRQVETGRGNGHFTQILAGLTEGDKVLLHPPDNVRDGTEVTEGN